MLLITILIERTLRLRFRVFLEGYAETQIYSRLLVERIFAFFVRPIMDCRRGHKGGETGENPHPIWALRALNYMKNSIF